MPLFSDLREIEQLIRSGNATEARKRLIPMLQKRSLKDHRAILANYCMRTGMADQGIRLLHRRVCPTGRRERTASEAEFIEYVGCLIQIGATEQAIAMLEKAKYTSPKALLYRASAHIHQWDYAGAEPLLKQYLKTKDLSDYRKLVGMINLAACCLFLNNPQQATLILRQVLHETHLKKHYFLFANALELSAQTHVAQNDWNQAKKCIELAQNHIQSSATVYRTYVEKWKAIISFLESKQKTSLTKLRRLAKDLHQWETLRDCDRYQAQHCQDEKLLCKVYFGTPHKAYKENLLRDFGKKIELPSQFAFSFGTEKTIDLVENEIHGKKKLRIPSFTRKLLLILAKDLYAPQKVATLHYRLYPGIAYDPEASPANIYEAIRRTRIWFRGHQIPLSISLVDGAYQLSGKSKIILPGSQSSTDASQSPLERMQQLWPNARFTARQASEALNMPLRTIQRELDYYLSRKAIFRVGRGRTTCYEFQDSNQLFEVRKG